MAIAPWAYRCEWAWRENKWQLALSFQFAADNDRDSLHRERPSTSALRTRKLAFNEAVSSGDGSDPLSGHRNSPVRAYISKTAFQPTRRTVN